MSQQAEDLIRKCQNVRNRQTADGGVIKGTRFMTYQERTSKEEELKNLEENLSPQNIAASSMTADGRKNMDRYAKFLRRDLNENAPPLDLPDDARNVLLRYERELADEIASSLQPEEVMRRNPPGAVGEYMRTQRAMKDKHLIWKNLRRVNNPGSDDEDLANIETLRRPMAPNGSSTFMANAQIPGVFAQSALAKENWPLGEAKIDTPLAQATRRENELMEKIAKLEQELHEDKKTRAESLKAKPAKKGGRTWTPEQREESRQRMAAFHAKKAAGAQPQAQE